MLEPDQALYDPRCDAFAALGVRDPHALTDADAAVARITEIYDRGVAIVAEAFARFKAGTKPERLSPVEAYYPYVGIKLERSELNLDARRSFGALHDLPFHAFRAAGDARALGPVLDQMFRRALECGKRVRSETEIGAHAVSVAFAAVFSAALPRAARGGFTAGADIVQTG